MANALYPTFKVYALTTAAGPDLDNASVNVKAALIDLGTYTYNAAHDFLDDISGIVATSGNLASKTVSATAAFDSADFTFTAATGATAEALILYIDSGSAATSRLIAYFDTGVTGLPVTPNGGDINVTVNGSGFFTL
jgi:hypothetical protein